MKFPVVQVPGRGGAPLGRFVRGADGVLAAPAGPPAIFGAAPGTAGIAVGTILAFLSLFNCFEPFAQPSKSDWSKALRDGGLFEGVRLVVELADRVADVEDVAPVPSVPAAGGAVIVDLAGAIAGGGGLI